MKKRVFKYLFFVSLVAVSFLSCSKTKSYADYVNEQNDAIDDYISRNKIKVVYIMPETDGEWLTEDGDPIYYLDHQGLYYHQIKKGDGDIIPKTGYKAYVRYVGNDLYGNQIYNHSSKAVADPVSFTLLSSPSNSTYGVGFQTAVKNMRSGGHCKTIIPFTIGNGTDKTVSSVAGSDVMSYRPMEYEIWLTNVE